jgi:hypothetical protein
MKYLILLMFILPFVVLILRMTLWGTTSEHRLTRFFQDSAKSKYFICMTHDCPTTQGIKPVRLHGTITEKHAKFLAVLLQVPPDSLVAVACPKPYQEDVKAALGKFAFRNVLVL